MRLCTVSRFPPICPMKDVIKCMKKISSLTKENSEFIATKLPLKSFTYLRSFKSLPNVSICIDWYFVDHVLDILILKAYVPL